MGLEASLWVLLAGIIIAPFIKGVGAAVGKSLTESWLKARSERRRRDGDQDEQA